MLVEVSHDRLFQRFDTAKCPAPEALLGDLGEEAFHLVQPRAACRNEVQVIFRMALEPTLDLGRFVSPVIVHDQVDLDPGLLGDVGIDQVEELDELLVTMPAVALDRKSTRLNSSHRSLSRMPSSA